MRNLLLVHAHPDDECISTGGTIARYARDGVDVCLVTCTNGELGEIAEIPGLGAPDEIRPRLADVRRQELRDALACLGTVDLRLLGYHDSGMDGTEGNRDPKAFINQPFEEVVGAVAAVMREVRPQVVVTYNEYGFYGHPDHIRAHEATVAAIDAVAAEGVDVQKLYYTAIPKSGLRMAAAAFGPDASDGPTFDDDTVERIGTDDDAITTRLDVTAFVDQKVDALAAHRTQRGTTQWFFDVPAEVRPLILGTEHFVLARTTLPSPGGVEADLFEGVTA